MKREIYTQTKLLSSSFVLLPETHQKAKDPVLEKVKTNWAHIPGMGGGKAFSREHQPVGCGGACLGSLPWLISCTSSENHTQHQQIRLVVCF